MRWGVELRHIPAMLRRGAAVLAVSLAGSLAGCASAPPPPSVVGLWRAEEIAGAPVASDANITLSLYGNGRAVGHAGCNNYTGSFQRAGDSIAFGPMISTKMACAPEVMNLEQSYLATLAAATRAERRPDGMLALTTDSAAQILLRRDESASLQDARARGVDFRAVGQEPGWVVEVKEDENITAVLDYGATPILLPTPSSDYEADGTVIYDASTDTDHLVLSIKAKTCVDPMSGESHPTTVTLTVNDKPYQGCGDWLD